MSKSKAVAVPAQKRVAKVTVQAPTKEVTPRKPRTAIGVAIQQRYLSRRQVATLLGCSIKFVISLVKTGQLAEHNLSKFVKRYKLEDVEKYLESRRQEPVAKVAA